MSSVVNAIDNLMTTLECKPEEEQKDIDNTTTQSNDNLASESSKGQVDEDDDAAKSKPVTHAATGYSLAQQSVYVVSEELPKDTPIVKGPDFNESRSIDYILNSFRGTGFQASNLAFAVDRINEMVLSISLHMSCIISIVDSIINVVYDHNV